ncbi:MAG: CRTAC1 family protein, partial [Abditibacteriales bacterium]|nr:CRTAC1 family protein [Abditibacteriales bacterium]
VPTFQRSNVPTCQRANVLTCQRANVPTFQPTTPALYRNNRDGTFTDVTQEAGLAVTLYAMGCAVGDYDNDGWMDVYISAVLDSGRLFRNNKGRFEDVTARAGVGNAGHWGTSCAWLDYDRDGDLDLYVANYVRYRSLADDIPCIIRGTRRSYCVPSAYKGSSGVLYRNNGDGTFTDVTRAAGVYEPTQKALGVAVCDYDDDGWLDIAVANDTAPNRLFHNVGGKFVEVAELAGMAFGAAGQARAGMGIDVADWRNDGTLAIAITNFPNEAIGFYTQRTPRAEMLTDESNAVGIAVPSLPRLGFGILFADWDNDGYRDLLAVNGHVQDDIAELESGQTYAQPALLYHNQRGEKFREVSQAAGAPLTTPIVGRGLAAGDYDNDGRVDVLVTTNNGPAYLWRNETPTTGHYLTVRLIGTRSNRAGIGARVSVQASGIEQRAWAGSASSYLSQSDTRVHFGLGNASRAEVVTVRWTSGTVDTLRNVPADRVITVREGVAHAPTP